MASEIAVSSAVSFFQNIPKTPGKPLDLTFSTKTTSSDIAGDALKFADQLVTLVNQTEGTDTDTTTVNIDEFTRLASGDRIKKFSQITDTAQKSLIQETFEDITKGRPLATASDLAEYLRFRDGRDGTTDGKAAINFLI
ncbi:MAG: hypothetical protein A3G34_10875 [Candidatus Lindowbacteria bacterium RIFCSPLOWO2_12_FULL_62_27]|nr:MAG: hypothetical protein A3G34_10875 [Candidatus Lindowbacteria bacterium RIFCSPLOWO2_12_FULL_62_27]